MKVGIDTNILIRSLVDDGSAQFGAVARLMRDNQIVIAPSVLLEAEWVLRDTFKLARKNVAEAFEGLLGASNVTILHAAAAAKAISGLRNGCDFADAFHLALSAGADAFMTFDKRFARRAVALGLKPRVKVLPTAAPSSM